MKNWKPNSWRAKTAKHLPVYDNEGKLNEVLKEILFGHFSLEFESLNQFFSSIFHIRCWNFYISVCQSKFT